MNDPSARDLPMHRSLSLSERILAAEIAVIRRDERIHDAVTALAAASRATGWKLLGGAGVAAAGSLLLWALTRLLGRRRHNGIAAAVASRVGPAPHGKHSWLSQLPWRFILARLWSLLPPLLRAGTEQGSPALPPSRRAPRIDR